ncbi:hypothetical protein [Methanobacterium congolense]|uniref:hypothetical protein n=1 Tax=Methanobacterium congolense TaxID=118062 RepID=UPI001495664D|nr:hypothetical protein [Methanobacterium congolense]
MKRKLKSSKSKKMVGVRCQCQERAVKRKKLLRRVRCRRCGKLFTTNREEEICFDCS